MHECDTCIEDDAPQQEHLTSMLGDHAKWRQRIVDWDGQYCVTKKHKLPDTQKVSEVRVRGLANMQNMQVVGPIPLREARARSENCTRKMAARREGHDGVYGRDRNGDDAGQHAARQRRASIPRAA